MAKDKKQKAHRFGLTAEKFAAFYLRGKGYRVLAERYRNPQGEIDIVALKQGTLVAVEVKARKSWAECEISITPMKQQKIQRAMQGLLAGHGKIAGLGNASDRNIRFDVIWITPRRWPRHIKDAWRIHI